MLSKQPVVLISVYKKDESFIAFVQGLVALGWIILASGGTKKALRKAGIKSIDVAKIVGGKAILGHRVVTLSREIHAGLLAMNTGRGRAALKRLGISFIDLVCVDFYAFKEAIANKGITVEQAIEMIDIGGPTMVNSGAKGMRIVVCDPKDRMPVLQEITVLGDALDETRRRLAAKAFAWVAAYYLDVARYLSGGRYDGFIGTRMLKGRYGENPQQTDSALYAFGVDEEPKDLLALSQFTQVEGVAPGHVNLTDLDRLVITLSHVYATFKQNHRSYKYYAIAVKHGNACGAAYGNSKAEVLRKMIDGNPRAIFGGMVITNFAIGVAEAEILRLYKIKKQKRLLDGMFAPKITPAAIAILKRPKGACKMLVNPALAKPTLDASRMFRGVRGGFLSQSNYSGYIFRYDHPQMKRHGRAFTRAQMDDGLLAAAICQTSNSNTTTLVKGGKLIGNGTTRPDRLDASKLALRTAREQGHDPKGAVSSTDSFYPFPDGALAQVRAGVAAFIGVSGSVNDDIVRKAIVGAGRKLVWIPYQIGRMFFGH